MIKNLGPKHEVLYLTGRAVRRLSFILPRPLNLFQYDLGFRPFAPSLL